MARYIMSHILFFITSIPTLLPAAALTTTPSSSTSSVSWRLALNFGREPSAPRGFASSGARFPVKFEAAFRADGSLIPAKDVISYTDFGGAVTRPIRRGEWERSGRELRFWLDFPEEFGRGDVIVPAGRLYFAGELWTASALRAADEAYFAARSKAWRANESIRDVERAKEAPKVWNADTEQWEQPPLPENSGPTAMAAMRAELAKAEAERSDFEAGRPDPKALSGQEGKWPGVEGAVRMRRGGPMAIDGPPPFQQAREQQQSGGLRFFQSAAAAVAAAAASATARAAAVGTWAAEPVLEDRAGPVSYY